MALRLQIVKDGEVVFEVPLDLEDWPRDHLERELAALETSSDSLSKIFDALSHETRLRMIKRLMEERDHTMSFAEFMRELDLNPKIVWENTRRLCEGGILEKVEKGRYRCSEFGRLELMMSLALRRLMEALEELERL